MTTFDDDERSVSLNRPIELYNISTPTATYLLTSHQTNVSYAGNVYTATTMTRGNQQVAQDLTGRELVVTLPIAHPLIQRFVSAGFPERSVLITLLELQSVSGAAQQRWSGFAGGITIRGHMADIRVPSITDDAMKVRLPQVLCGKTCPLMLFDSLCTVPRSSFQISTSIASVSGTTIVVASMGGLPDRWASPAGELLHAGTGERRQIISQIGTTLIINEPIAGAAAFDGVTVFANCNHDIFDCRDKFSNVVNFRGIPTINPALNPYTQNGFGTVVQA